MLPIQTRAERRAIRQQQQQEQQQPVPGPKVLAVQGPPAQEVSPVSWFQMILGYACFVGFEGSGV